MRTDARSLTRRGFVVAAGAAVAARTSAVSGASAQTDGTAVAATAPYAPAVRDVTDQFERSTDGASIDVLRADADTPHDGDAAVLVAGRPVTSGRSVDLGLAVHGAAALATPADTWRESLRPRELRDRRTGAEPVTAWSESDWESVAALDRSADSAAAADAIPLVRGGRSYQYATGRGGVGYYEVPGDTLTGDPDAADRDGAVPVLNLGYVHADASPRQSDAIERFLDFYGGRAGVDPGVLTYHGDPGVAAAAGSRLWR